MFKVHKIKGLRLKFKNDVITAHLSRGMYFINGINSVGVTYFYYKSCIYWLKMNKDYFL